MKTQCTIVTLIFAGFALTASAEPRSAMREGTHAFEQGLFTNAVAAFDTAAQEAPSAGLDPGIARFNRGVALFRDKQWEPAHDTFLTAEKAADMEIQGMALYNAGVTRLHQVAEALNEGNGTNLEAHLNQAIDHFDRSLLIRPDQPNVRLNLEHALAQRAALHRAIVELQSSIQRADQLIIAHEFTQAHSLLTNANQRLAPILKLGRPEAKTFEQYLKRTGQIVQILEGSTNNPPAISQ
ncbi:MAG: hypothetical protein J5I99_09715 [Verrucomicrobia bacterium]|nr:hypothetical protein [Verrucomicrobiota bacterium]